MAHKCPRCGRPTTSDWPLVVDETIIEGGCRECWEIQCEQEWWELVDALSQLSAEKRRELEAKHKKRQPRRREGREEGI